MSDATLPDYLRAAIGKGHAAKDVPVLVAALEAHGVEIVVRRLQLGDMKGEGFGKHREVYRSTPRERAVT